MYRSLDAYAAALIEAARGAGFRARGRGHGLRRAAVVGRSRLRGIPVARGGTGQARNKSGRYRETCSAGTTCACWGSPLAHESSLGGSPCAPCSRACCVATGAPEEKQRQPQEEVNEACGSGGSRSRLEFRGDGRQRRRRSGRYPTRLDTAHHPVRARRAQRLPVAADRRETERKPRPADHPRQPRQRGRPGRIRDGREGDIRTATRSSWRHTAATPSTRTSTRSCRTTGEASCSRSRS